MGRSQAKPFAPLLTPAKTGKGEAKPVNEYNSTKKLSELTKP